MDITRLPFSVGLSPRVRSYRLQVPGRWAVPGSISAGAELPYAAPVIETQNEVYLRGCGVTAPCRPTVAAAGGLSPRVRSYPEPCPFCGTDHRSISAGAELPYAGINEVLDGKVYLRGCGVTDVPDEPAAA